MVKQLSKLVKVRYVEDITHIDRIGAQGYGWFMAGDEGVGDVVALRFGNKGSFYCEE